MGKDAHASTLVKNMLSTYTTCRTYHDIGRAQGPDGAIKFRTWFRRPDNMRFDAMTDRGGTREETYSFFKSGTRFYSEGGIFGKLQEHPNFMMAALAGLALSPCPIYVVPSLLVPDAIPGISLADYEDWQDVSSADDQLCRHVRCSEPNDEVNLWIRDADSVLVQYEREWMSDPQSEQQSLEKFEQLLSDPAAVAAMKAGLQSLPFESNESFLQLFDVMITNPKPLISAMTQVQATVPHTRQIDKVFYDTVLFDEPVSDDLFTCN